MKASNTNLLLVLLVVVFAGGVGTYGGYAWGSFQRPCAECCVEGEMCIPEDEWALTMIGAVDDEAAAGELSKMVDACEVKVSELQSEALDIEHLPALTASSLLLASCRGSLAECRRNRE